MRDTLVQLLQLLFLVLHRLCGAQYNQSLLDFLRIDERLVDIGDDLTDYEDDVEANSFNLYRSYVFLYGLEAPLKLVRIVTILVLLKFKFEMTAWASPNQTQKG
jgi:hypothetical protein